MFHFIWVFLCACSFWHPVYGNSISQMPEVQVICNDLPESTLAEILGPAYNSRYMSIRKPVKEEYNVDEVVSYKRGVIHAPSFYVDPDYVKVLDEKPAWVTHNHVSLEDSDIGKRSARRKRSSKSKGQWECESRIAWTDLGPDYFPRYLRSVECMTKYCWYGHYKCKPRSFTVKLLRRRRDMCTLAKRGTKIGVEGLPEELRVLWVWEERAVNFCCDCTL